MKKLIVSSLLALLITAGTTLRAQDRAGEYLGLPGDNLNLYAVMNLFQESQTIEEFEKRLNDEDSKINNLDLNNDGYVDYIMVTDYPDGNDHNIVLQVALGPNEKQDVAVFTVERFNDGSVQIQLIGDDALYGKNYIVEPIYDETPNPGYTGRRARNRHYDNDYVRTTYFEVAAWPVVRFIYTPGYTVWRSSWYWGYYPVYWHPWTPYYWHYYYGYHSHFYPQYYSHYRIWHTPRYSRYNDFYYHHVRSYSPTVVVNINKGHYKNTYSRPQSRRDGEAMYARTHSDRSSSYSGSRRTAETRNSNRVYTETSTRRSSGTINNSRPESRSSASRREAPTSSGSERVNRSAPVNRNSTIDRTHESSQVRSSSGPDRIDRSSSQRSVSSDRTTSERVYRSSNNGSSGNTYSGRSSSGNASGRPSSSERTYRSAPVQSRQSSGSVQQSRSSSRTETARSQPSRSSSRSEAKSSGSRTSSSSSTSSGSRKSSDNENSRSRR